MFVSYIIPYQKQNMNKMKQILIAVAASSSLLAACAQNQQPENKMETKPTINKTESEWKQELSPEQFHVMREEGTERPFSGKYWNHHEHGTYVCAACGEKLFSSETKFDSGTGWPSYYAPVNDSCVAESRDASLGMVRVEVHCAHCGGHLGHVFDDGPQPTGLRYCINSVSLDFKKEE